MVVKLTCSLLFAIVPNPHFCYIFPRPSAPAIVTAPNLSDFRVGLLEFLTPS